MVTYRKFQFGWFIVCVFVIVIVFMTLGYIYQWGNSPIDIYSYIFFMTLLGLILLSFYGLTVVVNEEDVKIIFGIGLFTKKIKLHAVRSTSIVKYPVFAGYGIRFVQNGILYNVNGTEAVELKLTGKRDIILIGTDDAENLKNAIGKHLGSKHTI
ncbi:MAG TPA: hypothetical protein VK155_00450 [Bacteroidales bacterium]|jgi:hypothetical protein|nr:hypothetical protein [Bacteroidales bacterium]